MKGVFYYCVGTNPGLKYFKAKTKRQIKKYMSDHHMHCDTVFDPTSKPAEGVRYIDISDYPDK